MAKKKEKTRNIPQKNYFMALMLVLGAIFITFYGFQLYRLSIEERIRESYLMKTKTVLHEIKSIEELDAVLLETPESFFLYISYTNCRDVYELERDLRPIIERYNLQEEFYYLNITDMMDSDNYLDKLNRALNLDVRIERVPTILYFRNNELVTDGIVIRNDNRMIEAADFQRLLDKFELGASLR